MTKFNLQPKILVLGLSLGMMEFSADYKSYISETLMIPAENILLVPQGIGSKIYYDQVGLGDLNDIHRSNNYIGIDIGYNTIDIFRVIDGSTSASTAEGILNSGITRVAEILNTEMNLNLRSDIIKNVIQSGKLIIRGESVDYTKEVRDAVRIYVDETVKMIEEKYSASIDLVKNILFVGGGAALIKLHYSDGVPGYSPNFILIPKEDSEYYNVLGYLELGKRKLS